MEALYISLGAIAAAGIAVGSFGLGIVYARRECVQLRSVVSELIVTRKSLLTAISQFEDEVTEVRDHHRTRKGTGIDLDNAIRRAKAHVRLIQGE